VSLTHIFILLATGIGTGFGSGLLGLGGAFLKTPIQYMIYTAMGLPDDTAIKLAFGTSMLVILTTASSGAWRHHRRGVVWWKAAIIIGICTFTGSVIGATIATHIPGSALKIAFGAIILLSGARMLTARQPTTEGITQDRPWLWAAWAFPVGIIAGLLGIGGGILMIPVMVLVFRFPMHTAVGTSLAAMIFTSSGGVIGYIINGLDVPGLPPYSLGYVNLSAWLLLSVTSIGMAQVGAISAHRLRAQHLRYIFIGIMFFMGLKMVGLFDWLGWPI